MGVQTGNGLTLTQVWHSGTAGKCTATPCLAALQPDANFVLSSGTTPFWSTLTQGKGATGLQSAAASPYLTIRDQAGKVLWTGSSP